MKYIQQNLKYIIVHRDCNVKLRSVMTLKLIVPMRN